MSKRPKEKRVNLRVYFWVEVVLMIAKKSALKAGSGRADVWVNLILITGKDPVEAITKATEIGKFTAKSSSVALEWDDEPAVMRFLGLGEMGIIRDELEDGAEITWSSYRTTISKAKSRITSRPKLRKKIQEEYSSYMKYR